MRQLLGWLALVGAALCGFVGEAHASGIEVQPISLTLSDKRPSDMIALTNRGTEPVRFQVTAFAWEQTPDGELVLKPTQEIMFFPAMMTLNPQESRNVRVGVTIKPGPVEKTYRLFVQELPRLLTPEGNLSAAVGMLARMSIPVFLAPTTPKEAAAPTPLAMQGSQVSFALKNSGNMHFRPEAVHLRVKDAAANVTHTEELRSWYVLAGGMLTYNVKLPATACVTAKTIELEVKTEKGSQKTALENVRCTP